MGKVLRAAGLLAALALVALALTAEVRAAPPPAPATLAFHDRLYRASTQNAEVWLETSYDGGEHWYGTSLGGRDMVDGTYRLFGIGDTLFVAVANTRDEVWCKGVPYWRSANGRLGNWARLR